MTGQTLITSALTILGINSQGGTPSATDSTDALGELNAMWNAWQIDEGLIWAIHDLSVALVSGTASYNQTIHRLYKAAFVSAGNRSELAIINQDQYYSHNDLAATAVAPDEVFPNYETPGTCTLKIWPVISISSTTMDLQVAVPFVTWDLTTAVTIPDGYQDAIQYALAARLLPRYGVAVAQEVASVVLAESGKAQQRIREMNAINRGLQMPQVLDPQVTLSAGK